MNEIWEQILEKEGTPLISSNRSPFTLEDESSVWVVCSGAVDVFFVEGLNGEPAGMRQYLFRVETGGALFGLSAQESGYVLLAVGTPDTHLVRLPRILLQKYASEKVNQDSVTLLVEGWVGQLSAALTRNIYPRPVIDIMLHGQAQNTIADGKTISTQREILWLGKVPRESLYIGLEFLPDGGHYFPLSPDTWLRTSHEGVIETFPTAEALSHRELWEGLAVSHKLFLACHITNISLEKVDEHLKVKETAAYRDRATDQALQSLARVIDSTQEELEKAAKQDDPLAAASALVASAAKVSFKLPSGFRSEKYSDPFREILHSARIRARRVSLQGEWWREDAGPLLAFTTQGRHPVALLPSSPGKYNLVDPKNSIAVPVTKESATSISDTAYTFYRAFPDKTLRLSDLLAFGFAFSRRDFIIVVLAGLAASGLGFLVPIFTGVIFDQVIPENQHLMLYQLLVALLISGVAAGIFQLTRSISVLRIETRADVSLQAALWDRLLKLPTNFFRAFTAGELATRASGIESMSTILSTATVTVLLSAVFSLFYIILLFYYSSTLALWVILIIAITFLFMLLLARKMLQAFRQAQQASQKVGSVVFQLLTGINKLRSSGTESSAFTLWANHFRDLRLATYGFRKLFNYGALFYSLLPLISLVIAYYLFSSLANSRGLSTGMFLAFVAAMSTIISSLVAIGGLLPTLLPIIPIYENLKPVLQASLEVDSQKTLCQELKGRIEIHHVSFRYRSDAPQVLKDIDIQIEPGEHIALVGASGSGKSTLARLLLGFEKPESGTIYYDGQDLSKLDLTSVRRQIGTVLQNSKLNAGSVFQNITGNLTECTERDVWEAIRLVGLEEDIRQMPMGLYTMVSEGGGTLSGGQRQRLLLARALVHKPRLVIMDEATSFLDNQTQEIVTRSLDKMKITRIIIAHRISTVMNADTIYVVQNGLIAEKGPYQELMEKKGAFAELALRQMI
jgi:NHLM bacteriocin system ABC transporter ATP-binding protein